MQRHMHQTLRPTNLCCTSALAVELRHRMINIINVASTNIWGCSWGCVRGPGGVPTRHSAPQQRNSAASNSATNFINFYRITIVAILSPTKSSIYKAVAVPTFEEGVLGMCIRDAGGWNASNTAATAQFGNLRSSRGVLLRYPATVAADCTPNSIIHGHVDVSILGWSVIDVYSVAGRYECVRQGGNGRIRLKLRYSSAFFQYLPSPSHCTSKPTMYIAGASSTFERSAVDVHLGFRALE